MSTRKQHKSIHLYAYQNPRPAEHGKAWMYEKHRCWPACFACFEAARKYRKRKVFKRDTGQAQTRVDPGPARNAVHRMVQRGYSLRYIATETGLHENTVRRMYRNDHVVHYMMSEASQKILDLAERNDHWTNASYTNLEDPRLARLAIQGLMYQSFSQTWIGKQVGISPDGISRIVSPTHTSFIRPENIKKIVELARATGSATGTSPRSHSYAVKMKWRPTIETDALV